MATKLQHPERRVATPVTPTQRGSPGAKVLAMAGAAGIVLGALGIMGIGPVPVAGVAVIVLGMAIALAGGLFAKASEDIFSKFPSGRRATSAGFATEMVLGLVAAVCGVLALAGVSTMNLLSIGVIVLGMSLLAGYAAVAQFDMVLPSSTVAGRKTSRGSPGLNILCGVGAASLGILAWMGVIPRTMTLVADVFVGIAVLNIGYSISRRAFPRSSPRVGD